METVSHSKVKVEENGRKVIFDNPARSEFQRGRIDECLVTSGIRADYFVNGEGKSILIELKGCDLKHACEQLFAAVEHKNVKPHLSGKIGFIIMCSRFPRADTSVQLAQQKARKKYGAKFNVFSKSRVIKMSEM